MRKTKGFTLIELLAILVILGVIAVITIPIILNVVENSKRGAIGDSAYGYKSAVDKYYLSKLSDNSEFKLNGIYSVSNGELNGEVVPLNGRKPSAGLLVYTNNILKKGCLQFEEYRVTFEDGGVVSTEKGECTFVTFVDSDNNGSISLGDSVKIENDEFYVIAAPANGEVKLLAKYNLVSNSRQGNSSDMNVVYSNSSDSYWWDYTNDRPYDMYPRDSYGQSYIYTTDTQNEAYAYLNNYKSYLIGLEVTDIIDVRLMSYAEAVGVSCSTSSQSCPDYIANQYFWLGSAYDYRSVWLIDSNSNSLSSGRYYGSDGGVRPVVIIPESSIMAG